MTQVSENQIAFEDLFVRAQAYTARGDLASAEKILLSILREGGPEDSSAQGVQARVALSEVYEEMERQDEADEALLPYESHELDSFPAHLRGLLLLAFGSRAYWHKNYLNSLTL
ncbi:MAG TPA: hypothetical protein VJ715_19320, partial [Pyrinomonadaceae bacterium]|nr:hypothetical protein [Pyrinomonadaceae bacterium]